VFRCDTISRIFARKCRKKGIDAQVLRLGTARGPLPRMHVKWRRMLGTSDATDRCAGHHVVLIDAMVHDFTYRQFDDEAEVPHLTPFHRIEDEWTGFAVVPLD